LTIAQTPIIAHEIFLMDTQFISKFLKGSASSSLGAFATIAFHLLSITLIARHVIKEDLGLYFLLLAIVNFFKIFGGLGLDLTTVKFLASEKQKGQQDSLVSVIWVRLCVLSLLSIFVYLAGPLFVQDYNSGVAVIVFYLPVLFSLTSFRELFFHILQGLQEFKKYALVQTLSAILKFGLIWFFSESLNLLILIYIEIGMLLASLALLLIVAPLRSLIASRIKLNWQHVMRMVRFGVPLYLNAIVLYVYEYSSVVIIGWFLGPVSIALYEVAGKFPQGFIRLFQSFIIVYFPNLSNLFTEREKTDAETLMNKSLVLFSSGTLFFVLIAALFSQEIVTLVFTEKYLEIQVAFILLMFNVWLRQISTILGYSLVSAGHPVASATTNVVSVCVNLVCSLLFIPSLGYMGAVYSLLLMNIVSQVCAHWYLSKAQIRVAVMNYLLPILILSPLLCLYWLLDNDTLGVKVLIIVTYVILSVLIIYDIRITLRFLFQCISKESWWSRPI
jgi:O-antigen/teichoic acid export membrane protein